MSKPKLVKILPFRGVCWNCFTRQWILHFAHKCRHCERISSCEYYLVQPYLKDTLKERKQADRLNRKARRKAKRKARKEK
jgi:hypothetical protein